MSEESTEVTNLKVEVYDLVQQLKQLSADNDHLTKVITDLAEAGDCIKVDAEGSKYADLDELKATIAFAVSGDEHRS